MLANCHNDSVYTSSGITVGFEEIFTSVGEGSGSFELCVAILTDRALLPTHTVFSFSLDLLSLPGTAGNILLMKIFCDFTSLLQIPVIMMNSPLPTVLLWHSPLTPLFTDSVSMSISLMI